jgi:hypothetical protein
MNRMQSNGYLLVVIFSLLLFGSQITPALAQNYKLTSLFSSPSAATEPSINNSGKVAYQRRSSNPFILEFIIFTHDGVTETPFFNLLEEGFGQANSPVVINDSGAVAAVAGGGTACDFLQCLIRINPDQTYTILALPVAKVVEETFGRLLGKLFL